MTIYLPYTPKCIYYLFQSVVELLEKSVKHEPRRALKNNIG